MATVLIIDDDQQLCDLLSKQVRLMGHDAERAHTLAQGLTKARELAYDVVFLDVHLPDGSGLEAIPKIQQRPSAPEIIIITGLGEPEGAELEHLSKVFSASCLWHRLRRPSALECASLLALFFSQACLRIVNRCLQMKQASSSKAQASLRTPKQRRHICGNFL